jgi:transposase
MEHYAGIDVSLERSSLCVVDATGRIVREAKVASEPEALVAWFRGLGCEIVRVGLEAGPLSQWLYAAMRDAGLAVELLETRHVRDAFKAMPVKTDRSDARGIAQLMRLGWFRPVHCKSVPAQETRALLTARKLLQTKHHDVEMSLRGVLRGFGLKVGPTTARSFAGRIRELVGGHPTLTAVAEAQPGSGGQPGPPAHDHARCWGDRGAELLRGGGRPLPVPFLEDGWRAFRPDAAEIPIRRDRRDRADLQNR